MAMEYANEDAEIMESGFGEGKGDDIYAPQFNEIYLDPADYISGPRRAAGGSIPVDILQLQYPFPALFHGVGSFIPSLRLKELSEPLIINSHSFGYDCQRYYNLCCADQNTLIFASGNLIHFFDVPSGKVWFRRGYTGGGIGHICKNPKFNHIAVGENGTNPPIIIYTWPGMEIVTVLEGGTTASYSYLSYSPNGLLLLSQGGHPDSFITIWDWRTSKVISRCKSSSQDVYNVMYSTSIPGHLATCGSGHVKFWKMIKTFTGLKLKGQLGLFDKTEVSEIFGVYLMPDEKAVTGCEWGNILLWDEGVIKVEVCLKNGKSCHSKPITQFEYINGELVSVGMDGWIRFWFYETIDLVDPPDEYRFLEILPIYEFHITESTVNKYESSAILMCICKRYPENPEETTWFAQDGNGGIWSLDLNTYETSASPHKVLHCHAGRIMDMDVADWISCVATIGEDSQLHIYNFQETRIILAHRFHDPGSQVIWIPCKVEPTGSTLVCAFQSGVVRVVKVSVLMANVANNIHGDYVRLIQVIKPHKSAITKMVLNVSGDLLITGGLDGTVFVFSVKYFKPHLSIQPIGFVRVPSGVTSLTWKPECRATCLIGCLYGEWVECELPHVPKPQPILTYEISLDVSRIFKFRSIKSRIHRELALRELEKKRKAKEDGIRQQIERLKSENPGIQIDEETFLMRNSDEYLALPEIFIPPVPNKVLLAQYTDYETVWLFMAGYDAGYIYEYPASGLHGEIQNEPVSCIMVPDADTIEVYSYLICKKRKYMFFGMGNGEIRVCRIRSDHTDLSDYWTLPMHDNYNGCIPKILFSHDKMMLLSCGHDGNLFSYEIKDIIESTPVEIPKVEISMQQEDGGIEDIDEPNECPTLEEAIIKEEYDKKVLQAKQNRDKILHILQNLIRRNGEIMNRNQNLLRSQQVSSAEFLLDVRITADLNTQLQTDIDLLYEKLSFKLESAKLGLRKMTDYFIEPITCLPFAVYKILSPECNVYSLRQRKFTISQRIGESDKGTEKTDRFSVHVFASDDEETEVPEKEAVEHTLQEVENFLKSKRSIVNEHTIRVQMKKLLQKYEKGRRKMQQNKKEREAICSNKQDSTFKHPNSDISTNNVLQNIDNFQLKSHPKFDLTRDLNISATFKFKKLMDCSRKQHELRENFNGKLRLMRLRKETSQKNYMKLQRDMKEIHNEIPQNNTKPLPSMLIINIEEEFPERSLEPAKYKSITDKAKEAKQTRQSIVIDKVWEERNVEFETLMLHTSDIHEAGRMHFPSALNDFEETLWEREMKVARLKRKMYEQECILSHTEEDRISFDKSLEKLEEERLRVVVKSVYLELLLTTLCQEFNILEQSEAVERMLEGKVVAGIRKRDASSEMIRVLNSNIGRKTKDVVKLNEAIKVNDAEYMSRIKDNKFYKYLRKIYNKKCKDLQKKDEASSVESPSTSESSSTDDDDDDVHDVISTDSNHFDSLHFDETRCPVGCSKELYDMAFLMREDRYHYQRQIKEIQKVIDALHQELDTETIKLKILEKDLKANEQNFTTFVLEKLQKVHEIDVTVILKLHQLRHFDNTGTVTKVQESVISDQTTLQCLYSKIEELDIHRIDQDNKRKKDRMHLNRLEIDCQYMQKELKQLRNEIVEEMRRKFGRELSTLEFYQEVLGRLMYIANVDTFQRGKVFDKAIESINEKYNNQMAYLENLTRYNTDKLSIASILESEKVRLRVDFQRRPIYKRDIMSKHSQYMTYLKKLKSILSAQVKQKKLLQSDIRKLQ